MLCFRDMSFCSAECGNALCRRNFTEEDRRAAREWWGGPDAPVAYSDFSQGCEDFIPADAQ